ncbi:MAG TPA: zinc ribbon domain-containing protein [Chloroflexi bacterium]|nr:zinc ribbon domain-containing protein [Chloroflexota bacterium]
MIYCPICGTANRDGSKFCNECGARLVPQEGVHEKGHTKCPMCGALNPESNEVCSQCGARLKPLVSIPPEELPLEGPAPFIKEAGEVKPEEEDFLARLRETVGEEGPPEAEEVFSPATPEEARQVPVFPEEIIKEIPEEEIPDILASLRAKVREEEALFAEEEEEAPPEEMPRVEIPSWVTGEERPPEEKAEAAPEEAPEEEKPEVKAPPEKPPEVEVFRWPEEEEKPAFAEEEIFKELPAWEEIKPEAEMPPEEELPEWLKEAEEVKPPEEAPPPAEWLKEVELPWLEEEKGVEAPVMAEIPPWLEALRPLEEVPPAAPPRRPIEEAEKEEEGILAGLKGVLKAQGAVAIPERPAFSEVAEVPIKKDLLQSFLKLAYTRSSPPSIKVPSRRRGRRRYWLLYLVLFLAALVPLVVKWPPMPVGSPPSPPEVRDFFEVVEGLPSHSPVLVAFDYEPYMAGEMEAVARPVLTHLKNRGCKVAVISLVPTGPALAQGIWDEIAGSYSYGEDFVNLGYVPGREAGLRALASGLGEAVKYEYVEGKPLDSFPLMQGINKASDWRLVVILAGEPSTILWWIEQVGSLPGVRLAAAVSAGLKPYVMPYYQSGQLEGVIAGVPEAAHYEDLLGSPSYVTSFAPAQALAVLIALLVILAGNLFGGGG